MKYAILSSAAVFALILPGCGKKAPAPETEIEVAITDTAEDSVVKPEVSTPAPAIYTLQNMEVTNALINAKATFPDGLGDIAPQLAKEIVQELDAEFAEMQNFAAEDKAERPDYFRPYELDIEYSPIVRAGNMMSLSQLTYSYTGGAHPNTSQAGIIYDLNKTALMKASDLFVSSDQAGDMLAKEVMAQIIAEKIERYGSDADRKYIEAEVAENMSSGALLSEDISLLTSTEAGKFGGMLVMYSPYEMGPYAEGAYQAVLPQAMFVSELKPEFADLFGGEPLGYETEN